jgi:phytoene dehydrogenase-like protein
MFRYGAPGIVDGGCAALTGQLEQQVTGNGGTIRLQHEVLAIEHDATSVTGVRVRDRQSGVETLLRATTVISNIGPSATRRLMYTRALAHAGAGSTSTAVDASGERTHQAEHRPRREAAGLKVHLLSDVSIIPHRGIMYCLDTERIAGVVQPSNSDPRLAPPGKHLLITHQLMRSDDVNAEREAARADLRRLFGDAFGTSITILTMSQYRGEWPVNRAVQGEDVTPEMNLRGLYLVGDAAKPSGYLMVEGVAQSVNALLDTLGKPEGARYTPQKPSKRRAFHWLVAPPPPHPGS